MARQRAAWIRDSTRWAIMLRDDLTCFWCGLSYHDGVALTLDHVVRREHGGSNDWHNIVVACWACNSGKRPTVPDKNQRRRLARLAEHSTERIEGMQQAARVVLLRGAPWIAELKRRAREGRKMPERSTAPPSTVIVNITRGESYDVYIGRPGKGQDGYFGNPCAPWKPCPVCEIVHVTKGDTITCFERYARERGEADPDYRARVAELHGQRLGCFCAPAACHGAVLAQLAIEWAAPSMADDDFPF